jgi:uncharacterized protein YgbK (DUF1537 family)
MDVVSEAQILSGLPEVSTVDAATVQRAVSMSHRVIVVLDDDPTGTQTVAGVPVLTTWSLDDVQWAMRQSSPAFYILTNSRSLSPTSTDLRIREIMTIVCDAAQRENVGIVIASRSDSTLRGHFPLETNVVSACLAQFDGSVVDGVIMVPAYVEAGRFTIDSVHWLRTGNGMLRVGESEFAKDATFGYVSSDLRDYVEEKTHGRWTADQVARITLWDLRDRGVAHVVEILRGLSGGRLVVVDAVCDDDLRILSLAILQAEQTGKKYIYRVGPSFVRARAGMSARAPLTSAEIREIRGAAAGGAQGRRTAVNGMVIVGSHVSTSTRQVDLLLEHGDVALVEVDVSQLLREELRDLVIGSAVGAAVANLANCDVVIRTSRRATTGRDADESLAIARSVSTALAEIARLVLETMEPSWIVAKGGITSSDVATQGLGIRRAWARGTLLPGIISLWEPVTGGASRAPYVVFAGNVGDEMALVKVVTTLRGSR